MTLLVRKLSNVRGEISRDPFDPAGVDYSTRFYQQLVFSSQSVEVSTMKLNIEPVSLNYPTFPPITQ